MRRLLFPPVLFLSASILSASALAQTTIDITNQANAVCSYPTGSVSTGGTPGHLAAQLNGTPSGAGCVTGGSMVPAVTFGPASPLAQSGGVSTLVGGTAIPATFSALPLNATSCSAAVTTTAGTGTGTLTNGTSVCNSQAQCNSTLSIPATFTNTSTTAISTYNVVLTCNAATGANPPTTVSSATITQAKAGGGGGSCPTITSTTTGIPNFTQLTGNQPVNYFSGGTQSVDITSFDAIFKAPWPGNSTVTAVFTLPTSKYVAAQFKVPLGYMAGYTGGSLYGAYTVNNSQFSASISMTISTSCGDFANPATQPTSTVVPGCYKNKAVGNGFVQWRNDTQCILSDNKFYYLNIINADISTVQANGGGTAASTKNANCGTACTDPIANNPGNWPSYIFP